MFLNGLDVAQGHFQRLVAKISCKVLMSPPLAM
jgi:hypothetical protein